jgi:hypothetical protein
MRSLLVKYAFRSLVAVCAVAAVFTLYAYSIADLPLRNLPLFYVLPYSFWIGATALLAATLMWWFSQETAWMQFGLLVLWTTYLLIMPELMLAGLRGADLQIGHIAYLRARVDSQTWLYADFPGFHLKFAFIQEVLGLDHVHLSKFAAVVLHSIRMVLTWTLGWSLLRDHRKTLLFSLVVLSFLWVPLRLDAAPQNMGLSLYLLSLCLFVAHNRRVSRTLLALLVFFSATVTHPLSAYAVLVVIITTYLADSLRVRLNARCEAEEKNFLARRSPLAFACFTLLFGGWFVLGAEFSFELVVRNWLSFVGAPLHTLEFYRSPSELRSFTLYLALLFHVVVSSWIFFSVAAEGPWRGPDSERLAYLAYLPAFAMILGTGFYRLESVDRVLLFGAPFVGAFLATVPRQFRASILFLPLVLVLSFANRYSQEYNQFIPLHEVAGASFVVEEVPRGEAVFIGRRWSPGLGSVVGRPLEEPRQVDYHAWRSGDSREKLRYTTSAPRWRNLVVFHHGDLAWEEVQRAIYAQARATIYTNGRFNVYWH